MTTSTGPRQKATAPPAASDRSQPARAIAHAGALGDQGSTGRRWSRAHIGDAERERLAATLGVLLSSMRTARGLSTRQLAARSTVTRSTITRLEAGERRPRPAVLAALAYGLDHEAPDPLAAELQAAAGPSLRPDTPETLRRRARRLSKARREVRALRIAIGREAGRMHVMSRQLAVASARAFPVPPRGALTPAQLDRLEAEMEQAEALHEQCRRARYRADRLMGTLAWPYHPLWKEPLERALEES